MLRNLGGRLAVMYARAFAVPELAKVHYLLLRLALKGLGVLNYRNTTVSGERHFISNVLPRLIQSAAPVFIDVGAHQGDYSLMLAQYFPRAKIYAYEPHPLNFRVLSQAGIPGLSAFEMAIGASRGPVKLYDYAGSAGSSHATVYPDVFRDLWNADASSHTVMQSTLDAEVHALGVDRIDLLKIDTEGSELAVLQGAADLLVQGRIRVIQFEFNEMNVFSHCFLRDFRNVLGRFELFRLLPSGLLPLPSVPLFSELFAYQNILAVSRGAWPAWSGAVPSQIAETGRRWGPAKGSG